jgi:hypothetical protein
MNTNNSTFEEEFSIEENEPSELEDNNLDGEPNEEETDIIEIFTVEELEEYYYHRPASIPFCQLSNSQKGLPLEKVIRRYCNCNKLKFGIQFKDLARNKNHKKRRGILDVDFVINDLAAIEVKNWDCFGGKQYVVLQRDLNNQVLNKFSKYSNLKKILIIANPWWERDAVRYLMKKKVDVITLGFQVTFDTAVMETAFWKIKPELDTLLYINYLNFQRLSLTI